MALILRPQTSVGGAVLDTHGAARRRFMQASGGTIGAAWLIAHWPRIAAAAGHAHAAATAETRPTLKLLTLEQARDVEAIAVQIVPSGETPGAREAGVVYFVDQIHAGLYAARGEEFLADLTEFQAAFTTSHPGIAQFADLPATEQVAYLKSIEATSFFVRMRFLTVLGLLALPSYGGNTNKLGWQLVGFVDQHAWSPPFGYYDRDYAGFEPYPKKPAR